MVAGLGRMQFYLHECRSLKAKRKVVKAIIARLRNNFNASVAEVGLNDVHHQAEIGFAFIGNDRQLINSKMDKLINFAEELGLAEVMDTDMEIISL